MKFYEFANGDQLPLLGLGTWKAEPGEVGRAVKTAIRLGYRHIDCATIYANQAEIGDALAQLFQDGEVKRQELWITSKLWNNSHTPEHVQPTIEKTLDDLRLDYLDLYLIHWPLAFRHDVVYPESPRDVISLAEIPLEATWQAMQKLPQQGLCRHVGVSNFSTKKLQQLQQVGGQAPEVNQVELHPYLQQPKMLEYCQRERIALTGYAPLGSANRPEHLRVADEPLLLQDQTILRIAEEVSATPAQVILQWGIARGTAVIPKSVSPERLKENLEAVDLSLSPMAIEAINQMNRQRRYFEGSFWDFPEAGYTKDNLWDGE